MRITSAVGVEDRRYGRLGETVYEKKVVNNSTGPLPPFETSSSSTPSGGCVLSARPASAIELTGSAFF
jgi:hypothetical protein